MNTEQKYIYDGMGRWGENPKYMQLSLERENDNLFKWGRKRVMPYGFQ